MCSNFQPYSYVYSINPNFSNESPSWQNENYERFRSNKKARGSLCVFTHKKQCLDTCGNVTRVSNGQPVNRESTHAQNKVNTRSKQSQPHTTPPTQIAWNAEKIIGSYMGEYLYELSMNSYLWRWITRIRFGLGRFHLNLNHSKPKQKAEIAWLRE